MKYIVCVCVCVGGGGILFITNILKQKYKAAHLF